MRCTKYTEVFMINVGICQRKMQSRFLIGIGLEVFPLGVSDSPVRLMYVELEDITSKL